MHLAYKDALNTAEANFRASGPPACLKSGQQAQHICYDRSGLKTAEVIIIYLKPNPVSQS